MIDILAPGQERSQEHEYQCSLYAAAALQPATALQGHFMIYTCCSCVARVTFAIVPLCMQTLKRLKSAKMLSDCDCGIVDTCFRLQPLSTLDITDHFSSLSIMKLPMY